MSNVIVFKPGAPSSGNIYETAAEVETALASVDGMATVIVDASLAAPVMPAGVIWDFKGYGSLESSAACPFIVFPLLEIQDGAQIRNLGSITNMEILCDCTALPSFDYDSFAGLPTMQLNGSYLFVQGGGAPFRVPANASFAIVLTDEAGFQLRSLAPVVTLGTNASVYLYVYQAVPPIQPGIISGDATTTFYYSGDASAFPIPVWTGFTGTVVPTLLDQAAGVAYTPAVPGDWVAPPPATTQAAIDRLAAAFNTHFGPVP